MSLPAPSISNPQPRVVDALSAMLAELGCTRAYGLLGGACAALYDAVGRAMPLLHCRHESGAAFAAAEESLARDQPTVVVTTTGPGLTNALTGILAARAEGARVIVVSGASALARLGRQAFQETSAHTLGGAWFGSGAIFDYATILTDSRQLPTVVARLAAGVARTEGFVAHVSIPIDLQTVPVEPMHATFRISHDDGCDPRVVERLLRVLHEERCALWVGFGARRAADAVRGLAHRTGMPVLSTPRGKGIFPESDAQHLGVTGLGGDPAVAERLAHRGVERVLVLGSRLGELASFWDPALVPPLGFVHVDLRRDSAASAYPEAAVWSIRAEIGALLAAVLAFVPARTPRRPRQSSVRPILTLQGQGPVRPRALMHAIQHVFVERTEAVIMAEAGNAFAWAPAMLRFDEPGRFRSSTSFGSMGHFACGVLGAALGRGKAVAIVGDGAMLMNNELSTAVACGAPAVWVVLNNARYGMTEQGMQAIGMRPEGLGIPRVDFVAWSVAIGARGRRVEHEGELMHALEEAAAANGPFVVDVTIDPGEMVPFGRRNEELGRGGAAR